MKHLSGIAVVGFAFLGLAWIPHTIAALDSYGVNEKHTSYRSKTFVQTVRFQTVDKDSRRVLIENRERLNEDDAWVRTNLKLTASFFITEVISIRANQFIVEGYTRSNQRVVEIWSVEPMKGSRFADLSIAPTALGIPRDRSVQREGIVGGKWIHPTDRKQESPWVDRVELYRGAGSQILMIDPDGRYLILHLTHPDRVARIDLVNPGPPELLFTLAERTEPEMTTCGMRELTPDDLWSPYTGPGRAFALNTCRTDFVHQGLEPESGPTTYFVDADNDGLFDSVESSPPGE